MKLNRSQYILGIVIILIVAVVLLSYVLLHAQNGDGSPFSLGQYLNNLEQAALNKEVTNAQSTASSTEPATSATSIPAKVASPTGKPFISVLSPAGGTSSLTVVIGGGNFDRGVNYITFGPSAGRHTVNGLPDNVIAAEGSFNGKTLTFNVPLYGPSGLQCDSTGKNCTAVEPPPLSAGSYAVTVKTNAGVSNTLYFTLVR